MVNLEIARNFLIEEVGFDPSFVAGLTDELVVMCYLWHITEEVK